MINKVHTWLALLSHALASSGWIKFQIFRQRSGAPACELAYYCMPSGGLHQELSTPWKVLGCTKEFKKGLNSLVASTGRDRRTRLYVIKFNISWIE